MKWRPPTLLNKKDGIPNRKRWRRLIEAIPGLSSYLIHGGSQPQSSWVGVLRTAAAGVVPDPETRDERDTILCNLIDWYAGKSPNDRDVAVLSCLSFFSPSVGSSYLLALQDLAAERYIRCLGLAIQLNPFTVDSKEIEVVTTLTVLVSAKNQHIASLGQLVGAFAARPVAKFVTNDILRTSLTNCNTRVLVEQEVSFHLEQRKFATLYTACSWLQRLNWETKEQELAQILDDFCPSWRLLQSWRPKLERIRQWEHVQLDDEQRAKLLPIYDLDGPDTVSQRYSSLRLLEPTCYERLCIQPQDLATVDRTLDILYQAHCLGRSAVDLFIHAYVEPQADIDGTALLELCISRRDNASCQAFVGLLNGYNQTSGLQERIHGLVTALSIGDPAIFERSSAFPPRQVAQMAVEILQEAQNGFLKQLEGGCTGETIGMLIYDLGASMYQKRWMHEYISPIIPAHFSELPSRDVVEALFRLGDGPHAVDRVRFKSVLQDCLGGTGSAIGRQAMFRYLEDEVKFWAAPPDTSRMDLAHTIRTVSSLPYLWYLRCLAVLPAELDLYVDEMRHLLQPTTDIRAAQMFGTYLKMRRDLGQLQDPCWLLLLVAVFQEQGDRYLATLASSMNLEDWRAYLDDLLGLLEPAHAHLPSSGSGLTQERLSWWARLTQLEPAVDFVLECLQIYGEQAVHWAYLPQEHVHVEKLIGHFESTVKRSPLNRLILAHLRPFGSQEELVLELVSLSETAGDRVRSIIESILTRLAEGWPPEGLHGLVSAWQSCFEPSTEGFIALTCLSKLLFSTVPGKLSASTAESTAHRLLDACARLTQKAHSLDALQVRLRQQYPQRVDELLQRNGIEIVRDIQSIRPHLRDGLMDAFQFQTEGRDVALTYSLLGLGELQRRAKGIPRGARMLVVSLLLHDPPRGGLATRFFIHYHPNDQPKSWDITECKPNQSMIGDKSLDLFTCTVAARLNRRLRGLAPNAHSLIHQIHPLVEELIHRPPQTCVLCDNLLQAKLWKPAACSPWCSSQLQCSPLRAQLHNLLVDASAIDLFLSSIYAAATDNTPVDLLRGCPFPKNKLQKLIDELPPLSTVQTAQDLCGALESSYRLNSCHKELLSWLCIRFRGFILTAPDGFRIPNMGYAKQFVLVNSPHEQEARYINKTKDSTNINVAFHGTAAARLFSILTTGLKAAEGNEVRNGASYGRGIYLGDDQTTSLPYSGSTGNSWKHSELSNMKVMLGCEFAADMAQRPTSTIYLVPDAACVIVRYVFLLPLDYLCPPRHHVEPAMQAGCVLLKSGVVD